MTDNNEAIKALETFINSSAFNNMSPKLQDDLRKNLADMLAQQDSALLQNVKDAIRAIESFEWQFKIELIDIDHDAGDYASDGGDYIRVLDWLAKTGRKYPIHIHSMNVVGRENMQRIIRKNGWTEIL